MHHVCETHQLPPPPCTHTHAGLGTPVPPIYKRTHTCTHNFPPQRIRQWCQCTEPHVLVGACAASAANFPAVSGASIANTLT